MYASIVCQYNTTLLAIVLTLEREVSVSFDQSQYNVKEGDTLVVRFVVTGTVSTPFEVTVQSVNGTAFSEFNLGLNGTIMSCIIFLQWDGIGYLNLKWEATSLGGYHKGTLCG